MGDHRSEEFFRFFFFRSDYGGFCVLCRKWSWRTLCTSLSWM